MCERVVRHWQAEKAKRRKLWGRSAESASLKAASLKETGTRLSKDSPTALTPTNDSGSKISAGDEPAPVRRHSKKRSVDSKPSDRLSLFGSSFSGAIVGKKARKPVPRLSRYAKTSVCLMAYSYSRSFSLQQHRWQA